MTVTFWRMGYDLSLTLAGHPRGSVMARPPHLGLLEQEPEATLEAEDRAEAEFREKMKMV